jgi:hypothetical protein
VKLGSEPSPQELYQVDDLSLGPMSVTNTRSCVVSFDFPGNVDFMGIRFRISLASQEPFWLYVPDPGDDIPDGVDISECSYFASDCVVAIDVPFDKQDSVVVETWRIDPAFRSPLASVTANAPGFIPSVSPQASSTPINVRVGGDNGLVLILSLSGGAVVLVAVLIAAGCVISRNKRRSAEAATGYTPFSDQ